MTNRKYLFVLSLFLLGAMPATWAQSTPGYHIQLKAAPYRNQWVYLASYYGEIKTLADSAFLNAESKGVLKGDKPLPQGIYILASPAKTILAEMVLGPNQQFGISMDTTNLDATLEFTNSTENTDFMAYTRYLTPKAIRANEVSSMLPSVSGPDKQKMTDELTAINQEIANYRQKVISDKPESLLAALFRCMQELRYPDNLLQPKTAKDSLAMYRYGKDHYWDGVDFMDGRMVRTPVFEPKLTQYLQNWVSADPDSVIYEFNWMMALGRNDPEMSRYLIGYFVDHYMYPKIMGQDKVFLHVYNQYIGGEKSKVDWLNEKQLKTIRERAYMVMANQLGSTAWDMELADTAGATKTLYNIKGAYTIVAFWDVHCGKCKEELPRLDTLYRTKWKSKDVKVYAVMVNEQSLSDWKPFIRKHGAGWTHVHQTDKMRQEEEKQGKPNFRQLYDMRSTPTLFLLDKDKRIIAKNISLPDLDKVLEQKLSL